MSPNVVEYRSVPHGSSAAEHTTSTPIARCGWLGDLELFVAEVGDQFERAAEGGDVAA
jgi:hypothetical protein